MKSISSYTQLIIFIIKKSWLTLLVILINITLMSLFIGVVQIEMLRRISDAVFTYNYTALKQSLILFIVIIIINFLIIVLNKTLMFSIKKKITYACEDTLYDHFTEWEYWHDNSKKDVLANLRVNIPDATESLLGNFFSSYQIFIIIISGSIYGISINPSIVLVCIAITLLMVFFSRRSLSKVSKLSEKFNYYHGRLHNLLWEQLRNRHISGFLRPERVLAGYEKESDEFMDALLGLKKAVNGADLFSTFGSTVLIIVVALIGGMMVITADFPMADLLALIMLIPSIAGNFFAIPSQITSWKTFNGKQKKISELLNQEQYNSEVTNYTINRINSLHTKGITFTYPEKDTATLHNISLDFSTRFYLLVGGSGSGKSTLLKLIAGILPYDIGDVIINDKPLKQVNRYDYWNHMNYVNQYPVIVADTIAYNITLSNQQYDIGRLNQAITDACLDEWLAKQDSGLDTIIDLDKLSSGEIQRINMARAFYKPCDVLLLDEVTEALDPATELHIIAAIKRRIDFDNIIVIFVSHRLAALQASEKIIYITDGSVNCISTHSQLMTTSDSYKNLIKGE